MFIFFYQDAKHGLTTKLDESGTYGELSPENVDLDDLCGPPVQCPECPDPKEFHCKLGIYSLYDLLGHRELEIRPLDSNKTYPGLPNRTLGTPFINYFKFNNIDFQLKHNSLCHKFYFRLSST